MKNIFTKLFMLSMVAVLLACSEDKESSPHIVGVWSLQSQADYNVPSDYNWFASEASLEELGLSSYILTLKKDGTFTEIIERSSLSDLAYEGTWIYDEEEEILTLSYDDGDAEFDVVQNSLDLLKYSYEVQGRIISNADRTNLLNTYATQEELDAFIDTLYDENNNLTEEGQALFPIVTFDQLLSFKRSSN